MPMGVWNVYFDFTREEMIVYAGDMYVLNVSDGSILREFDLPSCTCYSHPILGSLHSINEYIIDIQTGKSYFLSDKGIYVNPCGPNVYEMLCAKKHNYNNQLTLFDWHS